eukprot:7146570-Prymnesium_polylepis.1
MATHASATSSCTAARTRAARCGCASASSPGCWRTAAPTSPSPAAPSRCHPHAGVPSEANPRPRGCSLIVPHAR